ncbi:6-bladed beta-propeller [Gemmatimonadota bacterium]
MFTPPVGRTCLLLLSLSALALVAQGLAAQAVVRDSAGIQIVENERYEGFQDPIWRLDETPLLDLTETGDGPEYEFHRVFSGIRVDDGRILVANSGSNELKVYSADGDFLVALGREGEGPGEFKQLDWVARYRGDSIFVYDYGLGRWSIFSPDGQFARSARVTTPGGQRVEIAQPFSNGAVMGMRLMPPSNLIGRDLVGMWQGETSLMRFSAEGEYLTSIASIPGPELWLPPRPPDQTYFNYLPALFGYWPYMATSGDLVFTGTDHGFEVAAFSETGNLRRLVRIPGPERSLTGNDVERFLERVREEHFPGMAVGLSRMDRPETHPWFSKIMVDAAGNLWISEYVQLVFDPERWTVFDSHGNLLGDVVVPRRFMILDIGLDFMLGRRLDDLDVEHVQLYRLLKGEDDALDR